MNFKKIIALLLCLVLTCTVLAGCKSKEETPDNAPADSKDDEEVMMTLNGNDVSKEDFIYFVKYYNSELEQYFGEVTDWTIQITEDFTYNDYVLQSARDWFMFAEAIRMQAERAGVVLTEEDEAELQKRWDELCTSYGTEEELIKALEEASCSKELYMYILESAMISDICFAEMFGAGGEKVTDEECAEYTAEDGFIMAKHILILTNGTYPDGGTVNMNEDQKADAKAKAQGFIDQLDACPPEEVSALFDTLMHKHTEDPGTANYPTGYLFQKGDMVTEFYEAAVALEEGQYSGIVETSYGYHIIMRVPVDYDVVPSAYSGYDYATLRYLVADNQFSALVDDCMNRMEITKDIDMENTSVAALLAVG